MEVDAAPESDDVPISNSEGVPLGDGLNAYSNDIIILYDSKRNKFHILSQSKYNVMYAINVIIM